MLHADLLFRALDLFDDVALDGVAHLEVLVAADADAALVALLDRFDIVLEATQAGDLALEDDCAVANDANLVVAMELAVGDVAARNRTNLGNLEGFANLGDAGVLLDDVRRKQADARGVDVLDRLVDDAIQANVDLFLLGLLL